MKHYDYYEFKEFAPRAYAIEDALNDCGSKQSHIAKISEILGSNMVSFFMLCIGYWSEAESYDGRNKYAVLVSREIAKEFPIIKDLEYDEELAKNAFAFTMSAHRYLQSELFSAMEYYFKENNTYIGKFLLEKDFIIFNNTAMSYAEYKRIKSLAI